MKRLPERITALFILAAVIYNHAGFVRYCLQWKVLANLKWQWIFYCHVVTPAVFVLFLLSFWSFGKLLLKIIPGGRHWGGYEHIFSVALGMGAMNILLTVLGACGIIYPATIISLIIAGTALAAGMLRESGVKPALIKLLPENTWHRSLFLVVACALFYNYITAVSPPANWDTLAYHLPVPKIYAVNGGICFVKWLVQKQCMIGMEMLTAAALVIKNDMLPQLFSLLAEVLLLAALFRLAKENVSTPAAWLCAAVLASSAIMLDIGGEINTDIYITLFSALGVILFVKYLEKNEKGAINLAGAFFGFAAAAKMHGLISLMWAILAAWVLVVAKKRRFEPKTYLVPVVLFILTGAYVYIRNYIWTGNPLFPFFYKYLGTADVSITSALDKWKVFVSATDVLKPTLANLVKLPYYFIFKPDLLGHSPQYFIISISAVFAARLFAGRKPNMFEIATASYFGFFLIAWFITGKYMGMHHWRLLLPALPFGILLLAYWHNMVPGKRIKAVLTVVILTNLIPFFGSSVNNKMFCVFGVPSLARQDALPKDRYLELTLDHYATYAFANNNLPGDSKVLLFREIRGYYLDIPYIWGDPLNQSIIRYNEFESPEELKEKLTSLGITHIIVNENIYMESREYYDPRTMNLMYGMLAKFARPVFNANHVFLYEIKQSS